MCPKCVQAKVDAMSKAVKNAAALLRLFVNQWNGDHRKRALKQCVKRKTGKTSILDSVQSIDDGNLKAVAEPL
jgi:hypothetical protein